MKTITGNNKLLVIVLAFFAGCIFCSCTDNTYQYRVYGDTTEPVWHGWNYYQIKPADSLAAYGYRLISNTAYYFGPKGIVAQQSNGMNCQNCHLEAGTIPWGNNYSAVVSTYPKFRDRSGKIETIEKRVNDCFERSLNGKAIDTGSREMKAIVAYMHWVGDDIKKGKKPKGSGIMDIPFLAHAADPQKGRLVYDAQCRSCHGAEGQGAPNPEGYGYAYPPLWGQHSYNDGAGLFRLSRLAGYIKNNMPFQQATYLAPSLTDEEAWNVAAFINTQPRPSMDISHDWPDISKKPVDHPFGPYSDTFSELQHKLGPFQPVKDAHKKKQV